MTELFKVDTKIENRRQSMILEGVYSKNFKNFSVKSGVRHIGSYTQNDYIINTINTTEMNAQNSYLFAQFIGIFSYCFVHLL
jgi:hypothetical protein